MSDRACDAPNCKRSVPNGLMITVVCRNPVETTLDWMDAENADDPEIVARFHEGCYEVLPAMYRERRGWPHPED